MIIDYAGDSVEGVGVDGLELVAGLGGLLEERVELERLVGAARDLMGPEGKVVMITLSDYVSGSTGFLSYSYPISINNLLLEFYSISTYIRI